MQITSDFSDRKLGENLRKWLSGPVQKKRKENEAACAAAVKTNTAFRCTKHNDWRCVCQQG